MGRQENVVGGGEGVARKGKIGNVTETCREKGIRMGIDR